MALPYPCPKPAAEDFNVSATSGESTDSPNAPMEITTIVERKPSVNIAP